MISGTDLEMICHLRRNAREKIATIAKLTNIPPTTLYDKYRTHRKKFMQRHVTLLDFSKLGLLAKANISIKCSKDSKDKLEKFLFEHPNVNTLMRINMGYDFLAEVVFRDYKDLHDFIEAIQSGYKIEQCHVFNVIQELKKEALFTKLEHMEVL